MMLLIDANNLAYRALYSFSLSHAGMDTSIVYGCIRMLSALIHKYKPDSVVACFDGGTPQFRKDLVPTYKQRRTKDGDERDWEDVFRQINEFADVMPMHGVTVLRRRYIEADDLMYWGALYACDISTIVTTDGDLYQALSYDDVYVLNPHTGKRYNYLAFQHEFGYDPCWHMLYKVLVGDGSDGVPGVKSIGPKTAVKLIAEFVNVGCTMHARDLIPHTNWNCLNRRQQAALAVHESVWQNCWDAMDLSVDRCGAKRVVAAASWQHAKTAQMKRYYMKHGFVSFIQDGSHVSLFGRLGKPQFYFPQGTTMPVVAPVRTLVEG